MVPEISGPNQHDFHDSSLLWIGLSPQLHELEVVLCVPNHSGGTTNWQIKFLGVLEVEFETVGMGIGGDFPVDIHDVYIDGETAKVARWKDRLMALEADARVVESIRHVVLASSFARGWGERAHMEGITVICQGWKVQTAPREFDEISYVWPSIDADQ